MKNVILILTILFATQVQAQVSILDVLPMGVEQEFEINDVFGSSDTCVYTYRVDALQEMEDLMFVEHRENRFVNALVYRKEGTSFVVRLITPDQDDEIQDCFIQIYRN